MGSLEWPGVLQHALMCADGRKQIPLVLFEQLLAMLSLPPDQSLSTEANGGPVGVKLQ